MDTTLEAIGQLLMMRPIQALAIAVFVYQPLAARWREERGRRFAAWRERAERAALPVDSDVVPAR